MALRCSKLVKTTECIHINQPKCRFLIRRWKNFKWKINRQRNKCWAVWLSWEGPCKSLWRPKSCWPLQIPFSSKLHLEYCVELWPHVWMILIDCTRSSTWSELSTDPALRPPKVLSRLRDFHAVPTGFVTEGHVCTPEISSGNLLWQMAGSSKEPKIILFFPFMHAYFTTEYQVQKASVNEASLQN